MARYFPNQSGIVWSVGQIKLNHASFTQPRTAPAPQAGLARLIRQVCLLRECGETARAAQLHDHELAVAVRDYRLAHGPDALPESELREMFAIEERRVAEAVILSELLAPRLVGVLPATAAGPQPAVPALRGAVRPSRPTGPPAISDLLDAMLAAERTGRPSAAAQPES